MFYIYLKSISVLGLILTSLFVQCSAKVSNQESLKLILLELIKNATAEAASLASLIQNVPLFSLNTGAISTLINQSTTQQTIVTENKDNQNSLSDYVSIVLSTKSIQNAPQLMRIQFNDFIKLLEQIFTCINSKYTEQADRKKKNQCLTLSMANSKLFKVKILKSKNKLCRSIAKNQALLIKISNILQPASFSKTNPLVSKNVAPVSTVQSTAVLKTTIPFTPNVAPGTSSSSKLPTISLISKETSTLGKTSVVDATRKPSKYSLSTTVQTLVSTVPSSFRTESLMKITSHLNAKIQSSKQMLISIEKSIQMCKRFKPELKKYQTEFIISNKL